MPEAVTKFGLFREMVAAASVQYCIVPVVVFKSTNEFVISTVDCAQDPTTGLVTLKTGFGFTITWTLPYPRPLQDGLFTKPIVYVLVVVGALYLDY